MYVYAEAYLKSVSLSQTDINIYCAFAKNKQNNVISQDQSVI